MKKIIVSSLIIAVIGLFACSKQRAGDAAESSSKEELAAGFQLLESNCFTCHKPRGTESNRLAPPMIAIKKHYIDEQTTKEEFTKDLTAFVLHPTEDISKMPGALKRFGLMPKMDFSETELKQIASYIYESKMEEPDWFEKHYQEERKKHMANANEGLSNLELGKKYAMATKSQLGKNLLGAIKARGTAGAVDFCNTRAMHLTDSMANEFDVKIRRLSDMPRNTANEAPKKFKETIGKMKASLYRGQSPEATTIVYDSKEYQCIPIITNKMCMQCHGKKGSQIEPETLAVLKEKYPKDRATGYKENELRGIWVVELN